MRSIKRIKSFQTGFLVFTIVAVLIISLSSCEKTRKNFKDKASIRKVAYKEKKDPKPPKSESQKKNIKLPDKVLPNCVDFDNSTGKCK